MSLLTAIFGSKKDKDLKALTPILEKVNAKEDWAAALADEDFPAETSRLRERYRAGESLDALLPEAFALAREASRRVLGERHYDVQIMGAVVLHQGKILEMKTGEGKTLTCVPAAYLNALTGEGVHVVTVNDYLASRDAEWMGRVYKFLGLSVGVILSDMDNERRREAYKADITYGTNNEFGFDYLRDNMKSRYSDKIQPKHSYCIVDEIDSILIDEARTPLIISGQADDDTEFARQAERAAGYLKECEKDPLTGDYPEFSAFARFEDGAKTEPDGDFMLDEKGRRVSFTKEGMAHMEEILQRLSIIHGSLYSDENFEYIHYVTQAVVAKHLYKRDTDYVVVDGEVQIVDEFTGRILYGRRYSGGLHQAIEAKEHIKVLGRNRTLATITFQNFFRMYGKLSGMTGTADTEAIEFNEIYHLDVVVIPTNVPVIRQDLNDFVYLTEAFKFKAVVDEIKRIHETGQPVLVGTVSIEKSELLSSMLRREGIKHEVLNAKNHAREAVIIENAGAEGAVTIATNMAGRGTDIKLGGSIDYLARKICGTDADEATLEAARRQAYPEWRARYERVKSLGGLYIIGTERHESRRIDNQLRGRSGRQGDPGTSRFFVSFEDNLLRLFARDSIRNMVGRLGMNDGSPLEHPMVSRMIETAQKRVEEHNFDIRKHLLEYDDVLNEQRNFIYAQRDEILQDSNCTERAARACEDLIEESVEERASGREEGRLEDTVRLVSDNTGFDYSPAKDDPSLSAAELSQRIKAAFRTSIEAKLSPIDKAMFSFFIQQNYLHQVDSFWQNHLEELEDLRDAVSLRSYAQKNPLVEYKLEGFDIFDKMILNIKKQMSRILNKVQIRRDSDAENTPAVRRRQVRITETHAESSGFTGTPGQDGNAGSKGDGKETANDALRRKVEKAASAARRDADAGQTSPVQVVRSAPKVGRNDPCPCGSGKKYKNCHGRNTGE